MTPTDPYKADDSDDECSIDEEEAAWEEDQRNWGDPKWRNGLYDGNLEALQRAIELERASSIPPPNYVPPDVPMAVDPEYLRPLPYQLYLLDHPQVAEQLDYPLAPVRRQLEEYEEAMGIKRPSQPQTT